MWVNIYLVGLVAHLVAIIALLIRAYYNREVVVRARPDGNPFETRDPLDVNWVRIILSILGWPILTLWALGIGYRDLFFH